MHGRNQKRLQLYRASVVVTGGHYSITTLLSAILSRSPHFTTVPEPLNPLFHFSNRTVPTTRAYEFFDEPRYAQLREGLMDIMFGDGFGPELLGRVSRVRSIRDAGILALATVGEVRKKLQWRPAIFQAPFAVFSVSTMQRVDGLRIVAGVRHPCAWIESILR